MPCRVPWAISPTTSGITLTHSESDSEPECTVVLGGGRLNVDGSTDDRRIELEFLHCYYARCGQHCDTEDIEAIGYKIASRYDGKMADYLDWRQKMWLSSGYCPDSGFYLAAQSAWLCSLPDEYQKAAHHYVLDGRDGYVELIARGFKWREWMWVESRREDAPSTGSVVDEGEG